MNSERIRGLLLRILSGRRRAAAYADPYDLAGLNNCPCRRRLIGYGAGGCLLILRLAFDLHPETSVVEHLSGRLLRFAYHVRDCDRATTHGKICNCSRKKKKTNANSAIVSKL